jgi:hypothetical protein
VTLPSLFSRSSRLSVRSLGVVLSALAVFLLPTPTPAADFNGEVLAQIRKMPKGGDYSVSRVALDRLRTSVSFSDGQLTVQPALARPSFCSGATYLLLLRTLDALRTQGKISISPAVKESLLITGQPDGAGIWGRWNANGPGTARLFYELRLGRNFESFDQARAGDFMKIFWTNEVGKLERGHSVVYLGQETVDGEPHVRFWSSNKPGGYGAKSVPRANVAYALFSRLETPENIANAADLPASDAYLAAMLSRRSSLSELRAKVGVAKGRAE